MANTIHTIVRQISWQMLSVATWECSGPEKMPSHCISRSGSIQSKAKPSKSDRLIRLPLHCSHHNPYVHIKMLHYTRRRLLLK